MDGRKNKGFDDIDEGDEADEPSGQAVSDKQDASPTPSQDEYKDEVATAVFPDAPDFGSKDHISQQTVVVDKDTSADEGPAPDQIPDFPDLEGIPKLTEGVSRVRGVDGQARSTRGDENVVEAESILSADVDAKRIPEDFFYNYEDCVSKPIVEATTQLPLTLLTLSHSFGYDCTRRANLHVLENDVVTFIAGNYLVILNVKTKKQVYIRSTGGRGIGAITVHPSKKYIAVGEMGDRPDLNIFEYPSLKLYRILRAGAERAYAFLDFSPNGNLLASMGAEPDYMLTLWNWKQEKIVLRCKAFSQDVFRAMFSSELPGQLTSSGIGHIRFWKMARTFTGLKLQGSLGRFGKREISDIEGYVELPDGKVLSGCESGNMLLWDDGLCINEISRKGKKPCHHGPIQQIIMDEGELITVGIDGYVRVWDFETTGSMQPEGDGQAMELEPVNELRVGNDVQISSMVRLSGARELSLWYAQDASGGIWKLDLSFQFTSLPPERFMYYHSGPIFSCGASPVSHLVATVGDDCTVRVYDFMARRLLCVTKFSSPATAFLWLPRKLDPDGATMFAGFNDGVIRLLCLQTDLMADVRKQDFKYELKLVFALKPHNSTITCIDMNRNSELLVTGSSDGNVFFFDVLTDYAPIGFVTLSSSVNHITWSPADISPPTILVSCADGKVFEVELPVASICDTTTTYNLTLLKVKAFVFESIKSRLRHEEELAKLAEEERERKRLALEERQKLIDKGLWDPDDDDAEEEMEDKAQKEKEKDKWEPVYPEKPSPVLCAVYGAEEGKFWVSMGAFDAGYFYECQFKETTEEDGATSSASTDQPIRAIPVAASNDIPVSQIIFSKNGKYALMGMQDGHIRIQLLEEEGNFATLSNHWMLGVHDTNYGEVTHLCLSYDERFLFSTGLDGNFFAFHFETRMPSELMIAASIPADRRLQSKRDIEDTKALSIEDAKQKSEYEKMLMLAEQKKEANRQSIERMKELFQDLHKRNNNLPPYLKLNKKEFVMDPEFVKEIERQKEEKISLLNKETAWIEEKQKISLDKIRSRYKDNCESEKTYLRAFITPHVLSNFRLGRRSRYLKECLESLRKLREEQLQRERNKMLFAKPSALGAERSGDTDDVVKDLRMTTVLKGSMGERMMKDLARVEEKKRARAARQAVWKEFLNSRLPDDYDDPSDLAAIQDAKSHVGDYKLKSGSDFVVAHRVNAQIATEKVIMHKLYIYEYKHNFNTRFLALRNKKMRIINRIRMNASQLQRIHQQIPRRQAKAGPTAPNPYPEEFPEKRYEYTKASLQQWHEAYLVRQAALQEAAVGGASPMISVTAEHIPHNIQPMMNLGGQDQTGAKDTFTTGSARFGGGGGGGGGGPGTDLSKQELSEMEKLMKKDDEIRLIFDQEVIIESMNDMIRNFDAELRSVRHEKFLLDTSMKNAQAREVVLLRELLLLKELEKEENVLVAIVDARVTESNETRAKIVEMQNKTELRRKEIEYLHGQEKALHAAFLHTLGDNKFAAFLTKVFKKKIKRARKKLLEGQDDDNESDSDSDDDVSEMSDDEDEDDDDEEFHMELDICPAGCDKALYDMICNLREDRLDIEEAMADERKARDQLIKEIELALRSSKKVEDALDIAEKDLEDFQLTKQKGLNGIDVTVTFKLHQLEYLNKEGSLILDFGLALAFEDFNLIKLQKRIKELQQEQQRQKKEKVESRLLHISLTRDRRLFDKQIEKMKDTCNEMMIKKFGRLVSIEKLETVVVNRELEEFRQRLHDHQIASEMELFRWQNRLSLRHCKQREFLKHNTVLNEHTCKLTTDGLRLEQRLNNRQRNVGIEQMDDFTEEEMERQQLTELVGLQVDEMNGMKQEIWALSRKDGTVFPPDHTPHRN